MFYDNFKLLKSTIWELKYFIKEGLFNMNYFVIYNFRKYIYFEYLLITLFKT